MNTMKSDLADQLSKLKSHLTGQHLFDITAAVSKNVRLSGSPEEAETFELIQQMLDAAGLQTQLLRHDGYVSLPLHGYIVAGGERLEGITHSFSRQTGADGITARIIDAGMNAPGEAGRNAVVLSDGIAMPGLVLRNERAGAAAQIFVCAEHTHEMCISTIWGSPTTGELAEMPRCPVVSVNDQTGQRLRELIAGGVREVTLHTEVDTGWRKLSLLLADIFPEGVDGLDDGETPFVLFSGHLDSWHYGAMDNGSANAVMIGVAEELAKIRGSLKRGLRLAFWSGHSHGRYAGSAWYVDEYHHLLKKSCIAHINIDSAGGKGATVLTDAVTMPSTIDCGARAISAETDQVLIGSRVSRAGDQSLVQFGVPSLFMSISEQPPSDTVTSRAFGGLVAGSRTGGLGWWWHTTEDTLDKLDLDYLERDGRIYLHACYELLTAPVVPLRVDRQAKAFLDELSEIAGKAGSYFDLSRIVELAKGLLSEAEALQISRDEKAEESNLELLRVHQALRPFIELSYAGSGEYAHDRTVPIPPVPTLNAARGLASMTDAERSHALVALRRARNYVEDKLKQAQDALAKANQA